ncbi:MAG: hypothetical protein ACKV2V_24970 [Blastocatellia bacterium]
MTDSLSPLSRRTLALLSWLVLLAPLALAQEFEIRKYDVNARVDLANYTLEVKTKLAMVNLSGADLPDKILMAPPDSKPKLSFYLNSKAKVATMTIGGAPAPVAVREDRAGQQLIQTNVTATIAAMAELEVELTYSVPLFDKAAPGGGGGGDPSRSGMMISAMEVFALPASYWIPVNHTPYGEHGADTAPVTLTVEAPAGLKVVSSGLKRGDTGYDNPYAGQPFFFAGDFDVYSSGAETTGGIAGAPKIEVYAPRGLDETGKQQAQRLVTEAGRVIDFYTKYFGGQVGGTFRIVSTQARERDSALTGELISRGLSFTAPGLVVVSDSLFRRGALDQGTYELLASAAARQWIEGRVLLRGRGTGFIRDALPVYLATQYMGERFGAPQREAAWDRYRIAYTPVARGGDAPLMAQNPQDRGYTTSMYNKGALVWRIMDARLGRQNADAIIRAMLDRQRVDILSLGDWRSRLCEKSRCASMKGMLLGATQTANDRQLISELFRQWIEDVVLPDVAVGQPQNTATGVESTVANFGNGDVIVPVVATTDKGEKLRQMASVKAGEFGAVTFPAGTVIKTVEADPDKILIQKDYTNDVYPRRPASADLYGQSALALTKSFNAAAEAKTRQTGAAPDAAKIAELQKASQTELAVAEAKAREAVAGEPGSATLLSLLGRVLTRAGKGEEARAAFTTALKAEPAPTQAWGWSQLGLGELALAANNHAEALQRFREAAAADLDLESIRAARDGAIRAEKAAGGARIGDDVRNFMKAFDAAVSQGSSESLLGLVEHGTLRRFAIRLASSRPSLWVTELQRAETLDANRLAVDLTLRTKTSASPNEYTGTALFVLTRTGGKLLLSEVPIFDVK